MRWGLVTTSAADRDIRKVPRSDLSQIDATLHEIAGDPYSGDAKMLAGMGGMFRRRVGQWRIFFSTDKDRHFVVVHGVKRRQSKTY
jgi:mRNA-degrading endonuclease RelE of RelBE toxin-antitoxin system